MRLSRRLFRSRTVRSVQRIDDSIKTRLEDFWAFKVFTDKAYIDPDSQAVGDVLREQGKRYGTENIKERQLHQGSKFHIAAAISWWGKSKLEFYNDEEDHNETPPYPSRPRRRPTTETIEEYETRVRE